MELSNRMNFVCFYFFLVSVEYFFSFSFRSSFGYRVVYMVDAARITLIVMLKHLELTSTKAFFLM